VGRCGPGLLIVPHGDSPFNFRSATGPAGRLDPREARGARARPQGGKRKSARAYGDVQFHSATSSPRGEFLLDGLVRPSSLAGHHG